MLLPKYQTLEDDIHDYMIQFQRERRMWKKISTSFPQNIDAHYVFGSADKVNIHFYIYLIDEATAPKVAEWLFRFTQSAGKSWSNKQYYIGYINDLPDDGTYFNCKIILINPKEKK